MNNIQSVGDLRREIRRLEMLKNEHEISISNNIKDINESIRPIRHMLNSVAGFFSPPEGSPSFLQKGLDIGISLLVDRLLLKNSSVITRIIFSFLAKKLASGFITNNSGSFMDKIKGIYSLVKEKFSPAKKNTYDEREIYNDY